MLNVSDIVLGICTLLKDMITFINSLGLKLVTGSAFENSPFGLADFGFKILGNYSFLGYTGSGFQVLTRS